MTVGGIFLPAEPRPIQATLPTLDPRGACSEALSAYLRCLMFRRWGGLVPDTDFRLEDVREEWPEPDTALVYPSASIVDGGEIDMDAHSFVPTSLEDTLDEFGDATVLWKLSEAAFTFQLDLWADDTSTREALAARLPSAFSPGEDGSRVILEGSPRYFRRPVRATLLNYRRMDEPNAVYPRERRLMAMVRCEIDVVDLRCATILDPAVRLVEIGEEVDPIKDPLVQC